MAGGWLLGQRGRRGAPALLVVVGCCLIGCAGAAEPYFGPNVPADGTTFVVTPGQPFSGLMNLEAFDDDMNGTAAGTLVIEQDQGIGSFLPVSISRSIYVGADPGAEPDCPNGAVVSPDPDVAAKCRFYCPETPGPVGNDQLLRCARWPASMPAGDLSSFSYSYTRVGGMLFRNRTTFSYTLVDDGLWTDGLAIANPTRRVCVHLASVDNLGHYASNGAILANSKRCWNLLFRAAPFLASCEYDLTLPRVPCALDLFPQAPQDSPVVKVAVGQTMTARAYFDKVAPGDEVTIALLADPGLPNGATIGPTVNTTQLASTNPAGLVRFLHSREITFTPTEQHAISPVPGSAAGLTFRVCFQATSTAAGAVGAATSDKACTSIQVIRPEPVVDLMVSCPGCGGNALETHGFSAVVRCPYRWMITMWEAKDFDMAFDATFEELDSGAQVGYVHGQYAPVATVDEANPLPMGAVLSEPMMHRACRDSPVVGPPFDTECQAAHLRNVYTQMIEWTPRRGDENKEFKICFKLQGARNIDTSIVMPEVKCSTVKVHKCKVCTLPGDTMESLAKEYRTDWLQLWGANVMVENPTNLDGYGALTIGPTYTVSKESEPLHIVAGVYGMDLNDLYEVNPDLAETREAAANAGQQVHLRQGQDVCVVPPVCKASSLQAAA